MNCLIITGGDMPDTGALNKYISEAGYVIGVDGTADFFYRNNIIPDVIIGDFDTADPNCVEELEKRGVRVVRLQSEKNETDTQAALDYAIGAGAEEIIILGALGGRIDHGLSNIMMLIRADSKGVKCRLADNTCDLFVSKGDFTLSGFPGQTISILPLTGEVCVNASGLKYPLDNLTLKWGASRGVSNVMLEKTAHIHISGGYALIIKITQLK